MSNPPPPPHPDPLGGNPGGGRPRVPWCDCGCGGDPDLKAKIAAERAARGEDSAVHGGTEQAAAGAAHGEPVVRSKPEQITAGAARGEDSAVHREAGHATAGASVEDTSAVHDKPEHPALPSNGGNKEHIKPLTPIFRELGLPIVRDD